MTGETAQEVPDLRTLILACARSLPEGASPEAYAALERLLKEHLPGGQVPEEPAAGDGYFAEIAFMGRIEYTGYVTQVTKHGQAAYHIDLPEKLWGGNPLAWVEHAASAWFSERPMTEASVRRQWESAVRAAAERARREAEWARMQEQRALTDGSDEGGASVWADHDPDEDLDDDDD